MTKVAALLPMKANSERVPGKNFKQLGHKPLFRWMLDSLIAAQEIDVVVINTDATDLLRTNGLDMHSSEFKKVVLRQRRPELVGDFVSMNKIIEDDILAVDAQLYLMTHVTNPFISTLTITDAIRALRASDENDSLFAVNRFQTRFYREDGSPINHDPANLLRTQDLEPWYEENSCLYLFTKESFAKTNARIGLSPLLFETPKLESIDIDEPEDWIHAESLAGAMRKD